VLFIPPSITRIKNRHELDRLQDDVARFTALIQKLTSSKDEMAENVPRGTERMPVAELVQCHGLACTHVTKAGIGMGFEHGHGFVLAKLPSDVTAVAPGQKRTMWSAPLFINLNAGSLGATLGWSSIDSVS
jgi:lipid-binding SYLF domain-containing protein